MAIIPGSHSTTQSSTIAIPGTYAVGNLIVVVAARANLTAPTVPAGWVTLNTSGISGISLVVACKYVLSTSEPDPNFASAQILNCRVYGASKGIIVASLGTISTGGVSNTINYTAIANYRPGVLANWYVGAAAQTNTANSLETPPTGMTNVNFNAVSGLKTALHDTNADQLSNWSATNVGPLANSAAYRSATIQLFEIAYTFPAGGGGSYSPIDNILIG
jgi:hypothetical protein